MRLSKHAAMVGLATATISFAMLGTSGCSNPPTDHPNTGTAGSGQQGTAGTGQQGTAGSGQQGTAGSGQQGTAGSGQQGTAGSPGTAGDSGTAGGAGGSTGGSSGTAGAGGMAGGGTAGAGTAGSGTAGSPGTGGATTCPMGVLGHCNADTGDVLKYPGFHLALAEEFDQAIDLDKDPVWTWSDGGPPEGQTRFNKSQINFTGGQMIITAIAQNVPPSISYAEPDQNKSTGTASGRSVLSGEFRTKYNNYRYGRYEAKYAAPVENGGTGADGNFLSTMFTFRTPKWKEWRELDLELEANIKTKVAWNMVNANGQTGYPAGNADASNAAPGGTFNVQMAHTYLIEWLPTKVTWYVDGTMIYSVGNTMANDPIPTLSAKIMMNLWVFGSAGAFGDPTKNKYPFHSTYDYFRFYKWDQETTYPMADPHTQLPMTDTIYSQNNPGETGMYP
jgi:hypothetical protein